MFTVLDVSRWQGGIDWDTVKASGRVHGVMLRALGSRNGTPYIDPMFETNYSACIRLGGGLLLQLCRYCPTAGC
mgnify:CR=1 FL=1